MNRRKTLTQAQINALLFRAMDSGATREALAMGAEPDHMGAKGSTPLFVAARQGRVEVVRVLLEAGAKAEGQDAAGLPLCVAAAYSGRRDLLELLSEAGMDVLRVAPDGRTALMVCPNPDTCRWLVEKGLDPRAVDSKGQTPIHHQARARHGLTFQMLDALMQMGVDIDAQDSEGKTALLQAVHMPQSFSASSVAVLLHRGANVHLRDTGGNGLWHHALTSSYAIGSAFQELFIEAGADPITPNGSGITPLHLLKAKPERKDFKEILPAFEAFAQAWSLQQHTAQAAPGGPARRL